MQIIRSATAGIDGSGDAVAEVTPSASLTIEVHSTVDYLFQDEIYKSVMDVVKELGVTAAAVTLRDRAALDYVIRARVEAALKRASADGVQESAI